MEKKKSKKGLILWSVLSGVTAILLAAVLIGTYFAWVYQAMVSVFLETPMSVVKYYDENGKEVDGSEYTGGKFTSEFNSDKELQAYEYGVCEEIVGEGAVLLKNNGALPLSKGEKVSCFSHSSVDIVYGGTGSGSVDTSTAPTLKQSLSDAGLQVNAALWNFYEKGAWSSYKRATGAMNTGYDQQYKINEVPWSKFTKAQTNTFAAYGDAAIVVIARSGGEGTDLAQDMRHELTEANVNHNHYLALSDEEKEMFSELGKLKANGTFKKIIVLVNVANAMELGFLNNSSYGIDAALWIGPVGQTGLNAAADILVGDINPSGRLNDTYALCAKSSPAIRNSGSFDFTNLNDFAKLDFGTYTNGHYVVEQEGIYVGYRYYETRYEDCVLGQGNAASKAGVYESTNNWNYSQEVMFPFGYGLSYTTFEYSNMTFSESKDGKTFDITVTVKNTGDMAGKTPIEIYAQSPYTDYDKQNKVEKSAIQLCGFTKTEKLNPNESKTYTVTVKKSDLKSYDYTNAKTYILDAGDYYFTVGQNVHDALNNILAAKGKSTADGMTANGNADLTAKWSLDELDKITFAKDEITGKAITNLFDDADLSYYGIDVTYLSRSDWAGTYPVGYKGTYSSTGVYNTVSDLTLTATDEMIHDLAICNYEQDTSVTQMPTMGSTATHRSLVEAKGLAYDDSVYEELLNQMSWEEMLKLVTVSGYQTPAIESINKPATLDRDGPAGISGNFYGGKSCMAYPGEVVMASTWNIELVEKMGKCIGEDALAIGYAGWYAPAINIHRTPFSGRNFEYYSEDGYISGVLGAITVKEVQKKGVYCYVKHFAFNDQEINRLGYAGFFNEQSAREIWLKGFEGTIKDGDAMAVMTSLTRVGCKWASAHKGLMTDLLRGEWGFDGFALTDGTLWDYQDVRTGLMAGTDGWLQAGTSYYNKENTEANRNDASLTWRMREACHRMLYVFANSSAMNPYISESGITAKTVLVTPWWKPAIITVDAVVGLCFVACVAMLSLQIVKHTKNKQDD